MIFPFGSNSSQTTAVNNALTNQVSIIGGPPGTGKTQTILNIIANLIIRGKTVEVVSNNNSATENVYEKLCKYGYDFLVAPLGRKENKIKFIENQKELLPDLSDWKIDENRILEIKDEIKQSSEKLNEIFEKQNGLAKDKQEESSVKVTSFSDDPNLLNVAVSRAIKNFTIIVGQEDNANTNIGDLVSYIEYNNFDIIESEIYSIFDYLYSQYQVERNALLSKNRRISSYDSENLMYSLIFEVLKENEYSNLGLVVHLPLKEIFKNLDKLNDKELNFVVKTDSHVDFMIYNKVNKQPLLAIEVDGYKYHKKGTRQFERDIIKDTIFEKYNLPLERFKTNGSGEKEKLIQSLNEIMN